MTFAAAYATTDVMFAMGAGVGLVGAWDVRGMHDDTRILNWGAVVIAISYAFQSALFWDHHIMISAQFCGSW